MRDIVTLACTECKQRNYTTTKNKKNTDPMAMLIGYRKQHDDLKGFTKMELSTSNTSTASSSSPSSFPLLLSSSSPLLLLLMCCNEG